MKANILGVKIDSITVDEILQKIKGFLKSKNKYFIVTPNPEFIVLAQKDFQFRQILNYADIAVPDGAGIMLAAKIFGTPLKQRVTGNNLVWKIADLAEQYGWSIYLLGGRKETAAKTAKILKKIFPNLNIAGAESGGEINDPKNINPDLITKINQAKPDILFVALGHGKQERFIFYNLDKLKSVKLAMGVGGVFDYISGNVSRAPKWMQKIGLEWLYRLIQQPQRAPRIYNAIIVFPYLVIKYKINSLLPHPSTSSGASRGRGDNGR
jgi:N-acetylglucosaminyldiphosphoundecaprenol N-acetyl-beta-D-mannosaminyltransferase